MKKKYKNQIIIYVIAFMLVTAGYLNYTEKNVVEVSSDNNQNRTDEDIGDAKLVNSDDTMQASDNNKDENKSEQKDNKDENKLNEQDKNKQSNNEEDKNKQNNNEENKQSEKDKQTDNNKNETMTTSNNNTDSEYFTSSKLERDNMYSQMLENYQKMLNNSNIAEDQKSIASQEIKNINNTKNSIMICENLIKTKGFKDVVIFVNGESVNIVVKSEKLTEEQVAQIQNIVTREVNTEIENIHIMTH